MISVCLTTLFETQSIKRQLRGEDVHKETAEPNLYRNGLVYLTVLSQYCPGKPDGNRENHVIIPVARSEFEPYISAGLTVTLKQH
jgi:hypothetical protein